MIESEGAVVKYPALDGKSGAHTLTCISWVIQNSQKFQKMGLESVPATRLQPELSMRVPLITAREWKSIAPHLPPSGGPGKPRSSDRLMLSGLFYSEACRCSLKSLPPGYGNPRSLRTRRQRWTADGTLAKLMKAGEPVVQRMRRLYWGTIREHTLDCSLDWKNSREFWGRGIVPKQPHLQPKGRYAADRRR